MLLTQSEMSHIKFAGIASKWNFDYAKAYAEKLLEMGMYSKPIEVAGTFLVAYSHKPFLRSEVQETLTQLIEKPQGESSP
jgi:hypothetical protein